MQNERIMIEEGLPPAAEAAEAVHPAGRVYAGFFVRLTAYLLDRAILCIPLLVMRLILKIIFHGETSILTNIIIFSFTLTDMILYALGTAYFVLLTYHRGRTLGKKLMRIRVVSAEDREPTFFEIFFRETFGRFLSAFFLCIGYLIIGAGDEKEALHDHLADTRVIYDA